MPCSLNLHMLSSTHFYCPTVFQNKLYQLRLFYLRGSNSFPNCMGTISYLYRLLFVVHKFFFYHIPCIFSSHHAPISVGMIWVPLFLLIVPALCVVSMLLSSFEYLMVSLAMMLSLLSSTLFILLIVTYGQPP